MVAVKISPRLKTFDLSNKRNSRSFRWFCFIWLSSPIPLKEPVQKSQLAHPWVISPEPDHRLELTWTLESNLLSFPKCCSRIKHFFFFPPPFFSRMRSGTRAVTEWARSLWSSIRRRSRAGRSQMSASRGRCGPSRWTWWTWPTNRSVRSAGRKWARSLVRRSSTS